MGLCLFLLCCYLLMLIGDYYAFECGSGSHCECFLVGDLKYFDFG